MFLPIPLLQHKLISMCFPFRSHLCHSNPIVHRRQLVQIDIVFLTKYPVSESSIHTLSGWPSNSMHLGPVITKILCEDNTISRFSKLCSSMTKQVWWLNITLSFWVKNQNFATLFQGLEILNQFTIQTLHSFKWIEPTFTLCLLRIHYLTIFVIYNFMMPWALHCKIRDRADPPKKGTSQSIHLTARCSPLIPSNQWRIGAKG